MIDNFTLNHKFSILLTGINCTNCRNLASVIFFENLQKKTAKCNSPGVSTVFNSIFSKWIKLIRTNMVRVWVQSIQRISCIIISNQHIISKRKCTLNNIKRHESVIVDKLIRIQLSHKKTYKPNEKESTGVGVSKTRTREQATVIGLSTIQKMLTTNIQNISYFYTRKLREIIIF